LWEEERHERPRRGRPGGAAGGRRRRCAALLPEYTISIAGERRHARPAAAEGPEGLRGRLDPHRRAEGDAHAAAQGGGLGDRRARRFSGGPRQGARVRASGARPEGRAKRADRRSGPRTPQPGPVRHAGRARRRGRQGAGQAGGRQEVLQARGRKPGEGERRRPLRDAARRSEDSAHRLRPSRAGERQERRLARSPLLQGRKAQEPRAALPRRQPLAHRAPRRQRRVEAGRRRARGEARHRARQLGLLLARPARARRCRPPGCEDTGLEHPTLINATTLDGVAYSIKVGKLEGENYYVRFPSSPYTVLVPKSKLEDTLKKRGDLLEKKAGSK